MTNQSKGTALITGASSGIGAVYADRLARRGYDLILVARNRERLEKLAARIEWETEAMVGVLVADLADPLDLRRVENAFGLDTSISLLLNNAGMGVYAPTLDSDLEKMQEMITLNVTALTRLTYAAATHFVDRGAGVIINISSAFAIAPELLNGVYGGTKAFVLALSQALLQELSGSGVRVQVVLPGEVATEFWSNIGRSVDELPERIVMSSDDLVDAALAGFDLGEFATIPSLPDIREWEAFESARVAFRSNLSLARPASRYISASPGAF
jgi:short-subunit dehydrogenase